MTHPARLLFAACAAALVAVWSPLAAAAAAPADQQEPATSQELHKTETSDQVVAATWARQADTYILRVVIRRDASQGRVDIREALKETLEPLPPNDQPRPGVPDRLAPYPIPNWSPKAPLRDADAMAAERASQFIADTIDKLRNLDPAFSCGSRLGSSGELYRVVEAWILKSDGALMVPVNYTCEMKTREQEPRNVLVISYDYSAADGARPVAATVRVGEDYYTEDLQALSAAPAAQ